MIATVEGKITHIFKVELEATKEEFEELNSNKGFSLLKSHLVFHELEPNIDHTDFLGTEQIVIVNVTA